MMPPASLRKPLHHWRCLAAGAVSLGALAAASAASQKQIVADFEDAGTWRMRDNSGLKTTAWWPAETNLAGSDAAKGRDQFVGELKFAFDPAAPGPFYAGFERAKMSMQSGFLDGIEWEADAKGLPVSLRFQIQDSTKRVFLTRPVPLAGEGWQHYRVEINAETLPGFAQCKFPARLKRVIVEAAKPCEGRVFLDDLAITGRFTKKDRLSITPIFEKLVFLPGEGVGLRYRLRNALPEPVTGALRLEVRDFDGKSLATKEAPFTAEASGAAEVAFDLGSLPLGAYEVALTAKTGEQEFKEQDSFVVMTPNNGRPNKHPMWFGVGDPTAWQGDLENRQHWEWMHLLGADINRMGIFADRFEPQEGKINEPGWRRLIQGHADAGVDIMVLYSDTPKWTHKEWKWRTPPDLGDKFETHARHLGAFLKQFPNVTYLEFWNEPDLDFFEGTLDQYLEMLSRFSRGIKAEHPTLPITSGGVTVQHPKEKPGFSKGMYERGAKDFDIVAYHSHGPLINTEVRHEQVMKWLRDAGLGDRHIFNTETGDRSLYTPEGRRRQAITLVKKIVFSKSIPNFDAYFWFTLQDYWDMDPEADDSFGLITTDNRAKPSFAAYNTLIRQLANTTPAGDAPKAPGLSLYAFQRDDGRYVYAGWPVETKSNAVLWVKTAQKLEVSDIFGNTREYTPLGGVLPVPIGELPLYIAGATPNEAIQLCPPGEEFLRMDGEVRYGDASKPTPVPVVFRNPTQEPLKGALVLREDSGREIAKQPFDLPAGQEISWSPAVTPEKTARALRVELALADAKPPVISFPVRLINNYVIRNVAALGPDPEAWPSLDGIAPITVDKPEQVIELAYDPNTPAWKGPKDLSATARAVHDGKGIRFQIAVTDDQEGPAQAKDKMWSGDDVQIAFGRADAKSFTILDLGKSTEGPTVWCSQHGDANRVGQWKTPIRITRNGGVTLYDVYLPYEQLGLSAKDRNLRFSFAVNENDGSGRIRWIEWTPGIARSRSVESLGYGSLE